MVVLPISHRLVGKESVDIADLSDVELAACTGTATIWSAPGPAPDDSAEDKLELIATGHSIAILPAGDRRSMLHDDVTAIPVEGIEPCQVVLASHADDRNPLVAAFHDIAPAFIGGDRTAGAGPAASPNFLIAT